MSDQDQLKQTSLHSLHEELGARLVPFAGYEMPVQYQGIMAEHNWTREHAGLFDVSHMGQCFVISDTWEKTAKALEALVPADILGLKSGQQRYTQLLNDKGGILDDLMIARSACQGREGWAYLVVNAARKDHDYKHISDNLPQGVSLKIADDLALIALQGPEAVDVVADILPDYSNKLKRLPFMHYLAADWDVKHLHITRSGYTGEDGFEISIKNSDVEEFCYKLLQDERVKPVGLGARDSLRLEAGLCLYGHDITEEITPIEGRLLWSIGKRRREEGGFPGYEIIKSQIEKGAPRKRTGLKLNGRAPAREGAKIYYENQEVGEITSGGFSPTLGYPIAMGLIASEHTNKGQILEIEVRGKRLEAEVVSMPFVPQNYYRNQ
jgi:aminomethyltransferase